VEQARLAVGGQRREVEEVEDLLFGRAVEDRRGHVDAAGGLACELDHVVVVETVDEVAELLRREQLTERLAELGRIGAAVLLELAADLRRQLAAGPPDDAVEGWAGCDTAVGS